MGKGNAVYISTCIYNGMLFCHIKNEFLLFATNWMDLKNIMLSEIVQSERHIA